jgi:hypothetical protein
MKTFLIGVVLTFLACGQPDYTVGDVKLLPWCGASGLRQDVTPYCLPRCIPDVQVRFVCTYNLGRLAFATPGSEYAYSQETDDVHCARPAVKIWRLTPRAVQPGPYDGGISTDVSEPSDCSRGSYSQNDVLATVLSRGYLFYDVALFDAAPVR